MCFGAVDIELAISHSFNQNGSSVSAAQNFCFHIVSDVW